MKGSLMVLFTLAVAVLSALYFWGSPWADAPQEDAPPGHRVIHSSFFNGSVGPAFDEQGCPTSVSMVLQADAIVTKAALVWHTKSPYEGVTDSGSETPVVQTIENGLWVETTLPRQGKLRLKHAWPSPPNWPWAQFLEYHFELEYVTDIGDLDIDLPDLGDVLGDETIPSGDDDDSEPSEPRSIRMDGPDLLLACGAPEVSLLLQGPQDYFNLCECPTNPQWWGTAPKLLSPANGASGSAAGEKQWRTLKWASLTETPDWHHAYLLEVRVTGWNRDDFDGRADEIYGDWCFADYYANGSQGLTLQQFDPGDLEGYCYLVVDLAGALTTEYEAEFHSGYEYIWRVRAFCPDRLDCPTAWSDETNFWIE
ncbi:MAG: hypothetical protein DRQ55_12335 [Planctomycetota bacterium]|nr:MAG: hypothetical protein DRQ55_12335 [Planctomycetota bacterium]